MPEYSNFYGPPGSGKTRHLVRLARACAERYGLDGFAFCTFTRTAADEARERVAQALGVKGSDQTLRVRLPYIGTIHSLAYKLCGVTPDRMLNTKRIMEFCDDERIKPPTGRDADFEPDVPYFELPSNPREIDLVRLLLSTAAHRIISLEDALAYLPTEQVSRYHPQRLTHLARQLWAWKRAHRLYDFDDLLTLGKDKRLPVKAIICDESQDNSPLLWSVVDQWALQPHVERMIVGGDFFQAIYAFMGADPYLFLRRPGTWATIGDSHRFGPKTVEYLREILVHGFGDEAGERLDTWNGVGGKPVNGSILYLARTNKLLEQFRREFTETGVPYRAFRGRAPLQTKAGDAYRALYYLLNHQDADVADLNVIASQLPAGYLPYGVKAAIERQAKSAGGVMVGASEAERLLGGLDLRRLQTVLPNARYFDRVLERYGLRGLISEPNIVVSTIHGAKGREADRVYAMRSWAFKPGEALMDPETFKIECCVAYVMCSRHRTNLTIVDAPGTGIDYPLPGSSVEE